MQKLMGGYFEFPIKNTQILVHRSSFFKIRDIYIIYIINVK